MSSVNIIRAQIEARMRAIDKERRALQAALDALYDCVSPPEQTSSRAAPAGRRARPGENLDKILPLIVADPELRPRDIATMTGIDARIVAATLSRLRSNGQLPRSDNREAQSSTGTGSVGRGITTRSAPAGCTAHR